VVVVVVVVAVGFCVPVVAELAEADDVSVTAGSAVVVAAADAGLALDGRGPAEPLTRTDIDDAAKPGRFAQDDSGVGLRALLAAATTPTRQIAPTPPRRLTRSVLDCAAYQSRMTSALRWRKPLIPPMDSTGVMVGSRGGSGRLAAFVGASFSTARRGC
jgi:hypothetical protein